MKYYTPRWLAFVGLIASFGAAFQLPLFGFMLAKIVFALMEPIDQSWIDNRDFWIMWFCILCGGIFITTYI